MITKLINTIRKILYKTKNYYFSLNVNLFSNIILIIYFLIMEKHNCKNGELTVKFNPIKCIHAERCANELSEVFSNLIYLDQFRSIFS